MFGGKITTYRRLADEALDKLASAHPGIKRSWTRGASLPGGDFPVHGVAAQIDELLRQCPVLEPATARRLVRSYGTRARKIIDRVSDRRDLGLHFGADLYQREVEYLIDNEWAITAEDILWRRSKLGLRLNDAEKAGLADWLDGERTISLADDVADARK